MLVTTAFPELRSFAVFQLCPGKSTPDWPPRTVCLPLHALLAQPEYQMIQFSDAVTIHGHGCLQ